MTTHRIRIVDRFHNDVATAEVAENEDRYSGRIDLSSAPLPVRQLFEEYEDTVNGQMFSLLDEVEQRVADLSLQVKFEDGRDTAISDVQVYPTSNRVSFRTKTASERVDVPVLNVDPVQSRN